MGTDNLFQKRRAAKEKRKSEILQPRANSFLIVTEGTKTEPNYFRGLSSLIVNHQGGHIQVEEVCHVDIHGEGCSPLGLVKKAEELVSRGKIMYQEVWIVFDKDEFLDFDEAISLAEKKKYSVAWSNESFEYWLFLHFAYSDSQIHRHQLTEKVHDFFEEHGLGKYEKNLENLYPLISEEGRVETAIANATRRMSGYQKTLPSQYAPGTTVHLLVKRLLSYLKET